MSEKQRRLHARSGRSRGWRSLSLARRALRRTLLSERAVPDPVASSPPVVAPAPTASSPRVTDGAPGRGGMGKPGTLGGPPLSPSQAEPTAGNPPSFGGRPSFAAVGGSAVAPKRSQPSAADTHAASTDAPSAPPAGGCALPSALELVFIVGILLLAFFVIRELDPFGAQPVDGGTPVASGPSIRVLAPPSHSSVLTGTHIAIRIHVTDPAGIEWIQVWDNERLVATERPIASTEVERPYYWLPERIGPHTIKVIAANRRLRTTESGPITLYVSDASPYLTIVSAPGGTATATPSPLPMPSPIPMPTDTPTQYPTPTIGPILMLPPMPTPTSVPAFITTPGPDVGIPLVPMAQCANQAELAEDLGIQDNSQLRPGATFVKTWRLRNSGTCTWDTHYQLVFIRGSQLSGKSPLALNQMTPPGASVDVTLLMTAPAANGTYYGEWQLRDGAGLRFGPVLHVLVVVRGF